jgi:hypothetical protein
MSMDRFTVIDDGRAVEIFARAEGDSIYLAPDALHESLGWELSAEGLCRESLCVPIPPDARVLTSAGIDLAALARVLQRPLAVDVAERAAYVGAGAPDRARALASLRAPDFALPDLSGRTHSLAEQRGRKVLLVAYASW